MKEIFYILIVGIVFIQYSCKPCTDPTNPECSNYDPCYGHNPVSADFIVKDWRYWYINDMYYVDEYNDSLLGMSINQDTTYGSPYFIPRESYNSNNTYKWHFVTPTLDTTIYAYEFLLNPDFSPYHNLPVTISRVVISNDDCLSASERKDSVGYPIYVKTIYNDVTNLGDYPTWQGQYKGAYISNPTDSINFSLYIGDGEFLSEFSKIYGLPFGDDSLFCFNNGSMARGCYGAFVNSLAFYENGSSLKDGITIRALNFYLNAITNTLYLRWKNDVNGQWYFMNARKL